MTKKEEIIERAHSLFMQRGFNGISLNDVIKSTGLSKGGFFHYFGSKDHLFKSVITYHQTKLKECGENTVLYAQFIKALVKWILELDNAIDLGLKEATSRILQSELNSGHIDYKRLGEIILDKNYTKLKEIKTPASQKKQKILTDMSYVPPGMAREVDISSTHIQNDGEVDSVEFVAD